MGKDSSFSSSKVVGLTSLSKGSFNAKGMAFASAQEKLNDTTGQTETDLIIWDLESPNKYLRKYQDLEIGSLSLYFSGKNHILLGTTGENEIRLINFNISDRQLKLVSMDKIPSRISTKNWELDTKRRYLYTGLENGQLIRFPVDQYRNINGAYDKKFSGFAHQDPILTLAISKDNKYLFSYSKTRKIVVWDLLKPIPQPIQILNIAGIHTGTFPLFFMSPNTLIATSIVSKNGSSAGVVEIFTVK